MGNMVKAKVKIVGTRPFFMHWFGPEALPLEKQERTGVAGNDPEEWRKTTLVTKDGQLYILPTYVFSAIVDGARYTKKGRGTLMKPVAATLQVEGDRIFLDRWMPGFPDGSKYDITQAKPPLNDPDEPVYLDIRGVKNPATRARNIRYRVASNPGWSMEFSLLWDKTIISRGEMEAILIDTGKLVGIGNGRGIGMGRFFVESMEIEDA